MKLLPRSWFAGDAVELAPRLLGKIVRKGACAGIIVETEAYTVDPASHAFKITPRSAPMRDTWGHWYVYFTYGMHFCANVTTNKGGAGAVLIRAVEPVEGIPTMQKRRTTSLKLRGTGARSGKSDFPERALCNGPAKFCQAFGITGRENGQPVGEAFGIYDAPEIPKSDFGISGRIGIKKGTELPWRFYIKGNPSVSRVRLP